MALLIALLFSPTAHAGFNRWTSAGPSAGEILAIAADPSDPLTVYAASMYSGIFRSRDGGANWDKINTGLRDLWITSLVVDPFQPATVYAGSYGYFVYKTTDRGDHWVSSYVQGVDTSYELVLGLAVDPSAAGVIYAASNDGVRKSTDGGCSWNPANTGLPSDARSALTIAVDPDNPSVVYLGTFQNGVYKSLDGGASWNPMSSGLPSEWAVNEFAFDSDQPGRVYCAASFYFDPPGASGAIYRSDDGGGIWSKVEGLPNASFRGVAMDPFQPHAVYAAASGGGVYRSADGGAPWTTLVDGLPSTSVARVVPGAAAGLFWAAMNGAGVFRTDDGGQTWQDAANGITGFATTGIVVDPIANSTVWVSSFWGGGAGIFKSTDSGRTWLRSASGMPDNVVSSLAVSPAAPVTLWAGVSFHGGIYRSADGGATWLPVGTPPGAPDVYAFVIPPTDTSRLYAVTGELYVSDDAGDSWAPASADFHAVSTLLADSQTPGTLFATADGIVQKSVDSGATWNPSNTGLGAAPIAVLAQSPADAQVLLAGVDGYSDNDFEALYRSADSGASWTPVAGIANSNGVADIVFDPSDGMRVYAAVLDGIAFSISRSLDGGLTWNPYDRGLPKTVLIGGRLAISSNGALIHAGSEGGVFELTPSATSAPTVLAVAPTAGSAAGGTAITITGSGFGPGSTVEVGGIAATNVQLVDDAHILATTAAGTSGVASVTVTIPEPQFDTLPRGFVFDFADLPPASPFYADVTAMALRGVTGGCGGGNFCPTNGLNRGQAAVQIEKALHGADYPFEAPWEGPGSNFMQDADRCSGFAPYIYQFILDRITTGCGANMYCQHNPVTRAQIAVFLLRAKHGPDYQPPPATGTVFADVPIDAFAADYIEEAAAEEITAGCGGGNYCPDATVTRAQAAVLINRTLPAAP